MEQLSNGDAWDRSEGVFDRQDLLTRCLGKFELAERVLAKFHSRFHLDLGELEKALRTEDLEAVSRVAHRLKGASASVAASELRAEAAEIESLARRGCLSEIVGRIEELRRDWGRFADVASCVGRATASTD